MCGIIGFSSDNVTAKDLDTLRNVLVESRIRGKHASGIAWYDGKKLQGFTKPIPIDELVEGFDMKKLVYNGTHVAMVAHARYSTSDIRYNQPIMSKRFALVHNGVITQSDPSTWEKEYGYKCTGKNDSELILRAEENGDNPLTEFPLSSIAAVLLDNTGQLTYMRNSLRPLWMGFIGTGVVYASTFSILERAGVKGIGKVLCAYQDRQRRDCSHGKATNR